MRSAVTLLVTASVVVLASGSPAAQGTPMTRAAEDAPAALSPDTVLFQASDPAAPFRSLFQPPPAPSQRPAQKPGAGLGASRHDSRIICGTVVIVPDASIDPGIVIPVPDDGVRYTIRTIEPPMCR